LRGTPGWTRTSKVDKATKYKAKVKALGINAKALGARPKHSGLRPKFLIQGQGRGV